MKISNTYFTRRPLLNINSISQIYEEDDELEGLERTIFKLLNDLAIQEGILIASRNLYTEIEQFMNSGKIKEDALISITKYILRMSSRPMPFGLFAGISKKDFEQDSHTENQKDVKVSLEWYTELYKKIEKDQKSNSTLRVAKNHMLKIEHDRIYIDIPGSHDQKRFEIRKSSFLTELFILLEKPMMLKDIISQFAALNEKNMNLVLHSIKQLLEHNFLVSHIRPNIVNEEQDYFEKLINEKDIVGIDLYDELSEVKVLIDEYKRCEIGQGIESYLALIQKMESILTSKRYVVVDLFLESHKDTLSEKTMRLFVKNTKFLSAFHVLSEYHNAWEEYCVAFLNKYGLFQEVKLLDLLDPDTGLGLPYIQHRKLNTFLKVKEEYDSYLMNLVQEALIEKKDKISLTDIQVNKIKDILNYHDEYKIQDGYDIKVSAIQEDGKEKLLLTGNAFGYSAGSFTGRFRTHNNSIQDFNHDYRDEHVVSAEINGISTSQYKDLGVTTYHSEYQIVMQSITEEDHSIRLDDLVVGMDYHGLYLKSKILGKKILPKSTHMLFYSNFNECHGLLFISQLGRYLSNTPRDFQLGSADKTPYVPRIEYENIVLNLKRWNILVDNMREKVIEEQITEEEYIKEFIRKFHVDKQVNILKGDRTLPIKTDTNLGIKLILDELKNMGSFKTVTLIEVPELNQLNCNDYVSDHIITVLPANESIDNTKIIYCQQDYIDEERFYDLDWSYYKIYNKKGKRNHILCQCIEELQRHGIKQYFFITYKDEAEHIRLRFKTDDKNTLYNIKEFLHRLVSHQFIKYFTEEQFLPEHSRYGGAELSSDVYEIFCLESALFYKFIQENKYKSMSNLEKGINMCIYTILDMFNDYDEALKFLSRLTKKNKPILKMFSSNRKKYVGIGESAIESYNPLDDIQREKREKTREYINRVKDKFSTERQYYILNSILHMTINRFIGIDRELEKEIYEMANYTFYNMRYQLTM